jgi:tetratricopeptide (TPR) repeat protein
MHTTEWTLVRKEEKITLQAHKLTFFQQSKVIECIGSNNKHYLLFFYKDQFLTVQPLTDFKPNSFLGLVKKHGFVIHAPNPLFSRLFSPMSTVQIKPITQLISTIKKDYSIEETALIISYFDSYMSTDTLESFLKKCFFTYRRNGKLKAAYRLAKILRSRGYNRDWITTTEHLDYANAANHFEAPLSTLLSSDPIYVEQQSFFDLNTNYDLLVTLYHEQNRLNDSLILYTVKWLDHPTAISYSDFIRNVTTYFNKEDDVLQFLHSFLPYVSPESGLHHDVYQRLTKKQDYKNAINVFFTYSFSLTETEMNELSDMLEHDVLSYHTLSLTAISDRLFPVLGKQLLKLERILRSALPQLLTHHSLPDIHSWLQKVPLHGELPVKNKINNMVKLMNDPDNQLELGMHYFDLHQYEKAIECFNWEMELNPNQLEPIKWLAKTYRKIGKLDEVKTYHDLLSQIQQSS